MIEMVVREAWTCRHENALPHADLMFETSGRPTLRNFSNSYKSCKRQVREKGVTVEGP